MTVAKKIKGDAINAPRMPTPSDWPCTMNTTSCKTILTAAKLMTSGIRRILRTIAKPTTKVNGQNKLLPIHQVVGCNAVKLSSAAAKAAYARMRLIDYTNMHYRRDIGAREGITHE